MRTHAISLLSILLSLAEAAAQTAPTIAWEQCLGGSMADIPYEVVQTTDGGYVVVGSTTSPNDGDVSGLYGGMDMWVVKLNTAGALVWQQCIGGGVLDAAYAVEATADNGVLLAGETASSDGDASGCPSGGKWWVLKLDSLGGIQWQHCNPAAPIRDIEVTADGGCVFVGGTDGIMIGKIDGAGGLEWVYVYGGPGGDSGHAVALADNGGYVAAGATSADGGDVLGVHGNVDYWVIGVSATGALQWQKCLGGSAFDKANAIARATDGGYLVYGNTQSSDGDVQDQLGTGSAWAVKLDAGGDLIWTHCYNSDSLNGCFGNDVRALPDGGFICAGEDQGDTWLHRIDANGNVIWQGIYPDGGAGVKVRPTLDGGYVYSADDAGACAPSAHFYIVKLMPDAFGLRTPEISAPGMTCVLDPSGAALHVRVNEALPNAQLALIDGLGREVVRATMTGSEHTLDVSARARGMYVIELRTAESRLRQKVLLP